MAPIQSVMLPDFFVGFLAAKPHTHPQYKNIKLESDGYMMKTLGLDRAKYRKVIAADFGYFASIILSDVEADKTQLLARYLQWTFVYDDKFDEPVEFREDVEAGRRYAKDMVSVMDNMHPDCGSQYSGLLRVFAEIWDQIKTKRSRGLEARYRASNRDLLHSTVKHIQPSQPRFTVSSFLDHRRPSSGARPVFQFIEFSYDVCLPEDVWQDAVVEEFQFIAVDIIAMHNDALSYRKEVRDWRSGAGKHMYNIIHVIQESEGLTLQEAFDRVGVMVDERLQRLAVLEARLADKEDAHVDQIRIYLRGVKRVVAGCLWWSFHTKRYFGDAAETVRKTGIIEDVW